jgi:inositol oxygenase
MKKGWFISMSLLVGLINADNVIFRDYPTDPHHRIYMHYRQMHINQTLYYVLDQKARYSDFNTYIELSILEAFELLQGFIDPSDPDVQLSNHIHNFQTAEKCRQLLPDVDWFHLVGLIHDIGKLLYLFYEPTWAIVGDTFPVGHPFSPECIYFDLFKENADFDQFSIYQKHCGFDAVHFAWGHDEYLYHVLKHNNTNLPEDALYIIRYHSFYPFHQKHAYLDLANEKDLKMLGFLRLFSTCDLYSKVDAALEYEEIKAYYDQLIAKYLPKKIKFFKPA